MVVVAKSTGRVDGRWRSATLAGGGRQIRLSVGQSGRDAG
jgi:hypothetical protein